MSPHEAENTARILVVDDDALVREVVLESIKEAGYDADLCGNGKEALARNESEPYDLIVTDMKLPGMDGLALIRQLKGGGADTDVIVITGYGSIENAVECMKAGALEYLIKPFTVDQIQVSVRKALEHRELKRRAREREFYMELSYVDALTGVHNRRFFDEALDREVQKSHIIGSSLLLLMIDIDDFKIYNDRYGHQKGDEALAKIGRVLQSACRSYDIVTRYGGEEFAILFPGADKSHAMELAARIINGLKDTSFDGEDAQPSGALTVSIGAACVPEDARNPRDLVRCADEALYAAKESSKNNVKVFGMY